MYRININDKYNNPIYEGDEFWAYMVKPSFFPPTKVKVIKDISSQNIECNRDYDVQDEKGRRLWNAYMVLTLDDRVKNNETVSEHHRKNIIKWLPF